MSNPKKREQEQAYIIPAELVEGFANDLLTRETIGNFILDVPVSHEILDTYYDTPDDDLRMSTVTLRTRVLDGQLFMGFKGKEKKDSEFTQDHSEWEFLWPSPDFAPEQLVAAAGLEKVQQRNTKRATRKMLLPNGENVAELNFDNSLYTVSTGQARIYETEVERQGDVKLKHILSTLEKQIPELENLRWDHGKFVTGKAIEFAFGVTKGTNEVLNTSSFGYLSEMFRQLKVFK